MTKFNSWVVAAVVPVWAVAFGCSDKADGTQQFSANPANSGDTAAPPSAGAATRPASGTVTLLGVNQQIALGTWSFSGPATGASAKEDAVSCSLRRSQSRSSLVVEASRGGADAPAASFDLELDQVAAFEREVTHSGSGLQPLGVIVALQRESTTFDYSFGADTASVPAVYSSCVATLTTLSERWATGQLACRDLVSTAAASDDRGSATIAFDCPIVTKSQPVPGIGGASSTGGTGGASSTGGTFVTAGTESGGTAGTDAVGGGSGGAAVPKSCRGVADSCASHTAASCGSVEGCSRSGDCRGVSSGCYGRSQYSCSSQEGCYWSSVSKICSGSAWSCSLFSGSSGCFSQSGCSWRDTCEGVSTSCILLSELNCTSQPGCRWE